MENLIEKLKGFEEKVKELEEKYDNVSYKEKELQRIFRELAPAFLYGGYIKVRDDYKVYIRTVEFYFHSEKPDGIHDPIVYHRNIRDFNGNIVSNIPYFPIMSLNSHDSGYDITFESETEQYRASVLIRSYEVKDKEGQYLEWDKKSMFVKHPTYKFNTQSLYLRKLLNGFSLGNTNDINWENSPITMPQNITPNPRKNVALYRKEGNEFKKVTKEYYETHLDDFKDKVLTPKFFKSNGVNYLQDPKLWQFKREDII